MDIQKDGDPATHMPEMDYEKLEAAITEQTKAIIAVDLGGIVCDYERLFAIAEKKKDLLDVYKRQGMVDAKKEQEVVAQLKKAKANILGVALNGVRSYSDDYGYYYRDGKKRKKIAKKRAFSRRS